MKREWSNDQFTPGVKVAVDTLDSVHIGSRGVVIHPDEDEHMDDTTKEHWDVIVRLSDGTNGRGGYGFMYDELQIIDEGIEV